MAKHNNGSDNSFQLQDGAFGKVDSHVGSLNINGADGSQTKFGKDELQVDKEFSTTSGGKVTKKVWRFAGSRYMPFPKASGNRDELIANIAQWMDALSAFDNASEFVLPNGKSGRKGYKLLVDSKDAPITVEAYVYDLITAAHTLASQKVMQTKLRDNAEKVLREERGIAAPTKAQRAVKVEDGLVDDGGIDASL